MPSRQWIRALARSWIATWYRTRHAFVLILCKSQRVRRILDNSLLFALRVCTLRSHRIKAHATADTMHKPLGFEVMHFILYVCVWLRQGVPVDQSRQQGYGRCCRMVGGESQNPDGTTPIPEDVADSTRRRAAQNAIPIA